MKLKTLKDLENDPTKETSVLTIRNIREEAVKIYKAIKSGELVIDAPTLIRWFADLTEEDLKWIIV